MPLLSPRRRPGPTAFPDSIQTLGASLEKQKALRAEMGQAFDAAYEALEAGGAAGFEAASLPEVRGALGADEGLLLVSEIEGRSFRFVLTSTRTLSEVEKPEQPIPDEGEGPAKALIWTQGGQRIRGPRRE